MRVRIRQHPRGGEWFIEVKRSWFSPWLTVTSIYGDNAERSAREYAERLKHPVVVEIE